jgi:glycosyltransferase 2 family protein
MTISFVGGVLISAVALYFAFRNVPLSDLLKYLLSINYIWVLPSIILVVISFILRAVRWRIILETSCNISIWRAFHPMVIGFMVNCVLPGRLGEVARPIILQKKEHVPFATGLATVAAERVFDIALLIFLFILTVGAIQIRPDHNAVFGTYQLNQETLDFLFGSMLKIGILLIISIGLFSIGRVRNFIYRMIRFAPRLFFFAGKTFKSAVQKGFCESFIRLLENVARGFTMIRHPKKILFCVVVSFLIWGLLAFSYYVFSLGSPGIDLTFFELSVVMVIICFFIALPSVPGWWGLWEAAGVFALSLFGVSTKEAAGFTLANHAIQVFPVIIMGLISTMILSVNIRQMSLESKMLKKTAVQSEID